MILLDSDHVSVLADGRDGRHSQLATRLTAVTEQVALPVVVLEEHLRGWLAEIRRARDPLALIVPYDHLVRLLAYFSAWNVANWTEDSAQIFSDLRRHRIRIGTQDLRIASISLSLGARLLSANLHDFRQVPGLLVEDWLHA